jgi:hypothetical protein
MQYCTRSHCAIRSHNHEVTFADFLELDEHYREIARSFKDDTSEKHIENYKILSDNLSKYDRRTCYDILLGMVRFFESTNSVDLDLKKLAALYVFSMCRTIHIIKFIHTEKSTLKEAVYAAYYRMLRDTKNDERFVSEMEKLVPF